MDIAKEAGHARCWSYPTCGRLHFAASLCSEATPCWFLTSRPIMGIRMPIRCRHMLGTYLAVSDRLDTIHVYT
jgi:hypothetical protein